MPERFECEVLQKRALHYIHLPTYIPNNAAGVLKDFQCALYVFCSYATSSALVWKAIEITQAGVDTAR